MIPRDNISNVFDRFFTDEKAGGTGLGLAIVKKIVAEHDGKVWCESENGWTQFFIEIPGAEVEEALSPRLPNKLSHEIARRGPVPKGTKAKHLIVDDDVFFQYCLEKMIRSVYGDEIEISTANTPDRAIAFAKESFFDMIWLDIDLGSSYVDGHGVLKEIREFGNRSKVCINTNNIDPELEKMSFSLSADFHMVKPLSLENLLFIKNGV